MTSLLLTLFTGSIVLFFFGLKNGITWLNVGGFAALALSIFLFLTAV